MSQGMTTEESTDAMHLPTLADIYAAKIRIAPHLWHTPLFPSGALSQMTGTNLRFKGEHLQRTGSFKSRGALNAALQLDAQTRARGVVTFSAGNHGQGLAFAARLAGIKCTVFMPKTAVPSKIDAIRGYGADARFGDTIQDAIAGMQHFADETGALFISPFAAPEIITGQGTLALEILEDFPEVEQIIVPIGGGGLIAGVALAVKSIKPDVRIVGVEPEGAPTLYQSLRAGKPMTLDSVQTVADGLAAPWTSPLPFAIIQRYVDDVVIVTDDEILTAMRLIMGRCKQVAEPSGSAALAALLTNKAAVPHGAHTVAILSGGNVDLQRLKGML